MVYTEVMMHLAMYLLYVMFTPTVVIGMQKDSHTFSYAIIVVLFYIQTTIFYMQTLILCMVKCKALMGTELRDDQENIRRDVWADGKERI